MMISTGSHGRLTTHVLDTAQGVPAGGLEIHLFRLDDDTRYALKSTRTNNDGRCDAPLLEGDDFQSGTYELVFHVGEYFRRKKAPSFLDLVPVRFSILDTESHYHIPLLVSPFGYSTYRGS